MITAVLFDLDGTLLPMDNDFFVEGYFKLLAKKLSPIGYDSEKLIKGIWHGISAMVKNDGSVTNEEAFWKSFSEIFGERVYSDKPVFEDFYGNEFRQAKQFCGFSSYAAETVRLVKKKGLKAVLATNPLFPEVATRLRIDWAGLNADDFHTFTVYETSKFCKPNPAYYTELLKRIGEKPENCLMIGNDAYEDMWAAQQAGLSTFLLTDCLINRKNDDISAYRHGDFPALIKFLDEEL